MLVLTRRVNERVFIGSDIEVMVVAVGSNQVKLGIKAPKDVPVHREEVARRIEQEGASVEREESRKSIYQACLDAREAVLREMAAVGEDDLEVYEAFHEELSGLCDSWFARIEEMVDELSQDEE